MMFSSASSRLFLIVVSLFLATAPAANNQPGYVCDTQIARSVVDALLDKDIEGARQRLDVWHTSKPHHPSLPLYQAMTLVAEADYSTERDTARYDSAIAALEKVIARHEAELERGDDHWLTRLNLATAQALAGRLLMEQGHWLSAFNLGYESRQTMNALLQEKPELIDAKLIVGMFEYVSGTVPSSVRWLTALVGFSGDASKGIAYLEEVVEKAEVAAPEAAEALLVEVKHSPEAACRYLDLATTMRKRYPHNARYQWAQYRLEKACKQAEPNKRAKVRSFQLAEAHCP